MMNPFKNVLWSFRKFLGFTMHRKGIELDLAKVKATQDMEPPTDP